MNFNKDSHVLVTGATGFVGAWCCKYALDQGLRVTGTVRSSAKGDYLKRLFNGQPFDYLIVQDISKLGAYDEVFKHHVFDGVLQTASPVTMDADDPDELIIPAVNGVRSLLEAVHKYGPSVKRIVMTSSDAAIRVHSLPPPKIFDESSWDTESVDLCKKYGRRAPGPAKYRASKILAEKAFWDFAVQHPVKFTQSVVNPTLVGGPPIQEMTSEAALNFSIRDFYTYIFNPPSSAKGITNNIDNYVDVRDIAALHYLALTRPEAEGKRFIGSIGAVCFQDLSAILNPYDDSLKLPRGTPGAEKKADSPAHAVIVDGQRATRLLGLKYISMKDSVIDMYEEFKRRRQTWAAVAAHEQMETSHFPASDKDRGCWSSVKNLLDSLQESVWGQPIRLDDDAEVTKEKGHLVL